MKFKLKSTITVIFFLMAFWAVSQPGGGRPPGGGGGGPCPNPPCNPVPVTGIEWILGAGALLGASKLRRKK